MLTEQEKTEIQNSFKSICYGCIHARKPASEENTKKGYVGCSGRAKEIPFDYDVIIEASEIGEGWVDLRSEVFGSSSGSITNMQLLTKQVKSCIKFDKSGHS